MTETLLFLAVLLLLLGTPFLRETMIYLKGSLHQNHRSANFAQANIAIHQAEAAEGKRHTIPCR
jgi:hypothetical protein